MKSCICCCSVIHSGLTLCNPMDCTTPDLPAHHQLPELTPNSCPSSQWYHPAISSSVVPFSSCPQSLPASGFFLMSQLFVSGGQSIAVSASTSVLPMNTQDWFPLGWTGWISMQSKGLSRVFSNTTVQNHQFSEPSFLYDPTLTITVPTNGGMEIQIYTWNIIQLLKRRKSNHLQ